MNRKIRKNLKDIWNAYMVEGATFGKFDIPYCPTTATEIPKEIVSWVEAKSIYRKHKHNLNFKYNAYVCFYVDDHLFDSTLGIWFRPKKALSILKHFAGVITPDFSTYQDFPIAIQIYATYRMRSYGYWLGKNDFAVINNVRGGLQNTFEFCFEGIPQNSVVAIGTVGGSPFKLIDRERFEEWLFEMVRRLKPHTIIVYGSANYPCFEQLKNWGITVISYKSHTNRAFEKRRKNHE